MSDSRPAGPHAYNMQALLAMAQGIPRQPIRSQQVEGGIGFKAVKEELQVLPPDKLPKPGQARTAAAYLSRSSVS